MLLSRVLPATDRPVRSVEARPTACSSTPPVNVRPSMSFEVTCAPVNDCGNTRASFARRIGNFGSKVP
ncbi:hypothetical protein D3C79_912250 [compost metagenome]